MTTNPAPVSPLAFLPPEERARFSRALAGAVVAELDRLAATGRTRKESPSEHPANTTAPASAHAGAAPSTR